MLRAEWSWCHAHTLLQAASNTADELMHTGFLNTVRVTLFLWGNGQGQEGGEGRGSVGRWGGGGGGWTWSTLASTASAEKMKLMTVRA